ncbi:MAG: hypothetical protein VX730_02405 [Pseudomonadota bacterium]|nr:hypothetical protein [Pseudomonadota bacterium]
MKDKVLAELKKLKAKDANSFLRHPVFKLGASLTCTLVIWSALIPTGMETLEDGKEDLSQNKKELRALRELSGQIYALERKLVGLDEGSDTKRKEESPLKQVERLAKEAKVFGRISRITPLSKETESGRTQGLTIEFEEIDMASLTPFLHAITYRSILDVKELSMNKQPSKGEGILSARVVAWEL